MAIKNVRMNLWDQIAGWLVLVGAVNWGLFKVFSFDLVAWLLGMINLMAYSMWVYGIVGLSGVYFIYRVLTKFK